MIAVYNVAHSLPLGSVGRDIPFTENETGIMHYAKKLSVTILLLAVTAAILALIVVIIIFMMSGVLLVAVLLATVAIMVVAGVQEVINTFKYHVFAPMGRFQLEIVYLHFPPSFHQTVVVSVL